MLGWVMDLYHLTKHENACKIRDEGFRADAGSTYESKGTWLAEEWGAVRAMGFLGLDVVIKVTLPDSQLVGCERTASSLPGNRQWCVPSDIVNDHRGTWEFYRIDGDDELVAL